MTEPDIYKMTDSELISRLRDYLWQSRRIAMQLQDRGYLVQIPEDADRPTIAKLVPEETK